MFCNTIEYNEIILAHATAIGNAFLSARLYRDVSRYRRGSTHDSCDHSSLYGGGIELINEDRRISPKNKMRAVDCCKALIEGKGLGSDGIDFLLILFGELADYYATRADRTESRLAHIEDD